MTGVLHTVDRYTKLAGKNRLELLLFRLAGGQLYGLNVFKIREVIKCDKFSLIPTKHQAVCGLATVRNESIPIIDLSMSIKYKPLLNPQSCFLVITEFNQSVQGFLVGSVSKIVNVGWDHVHPPPIGANTEAGSYLTAVVNIDDSIVEILDVEKVLMEIYPVDMTIPDVYPRNSNEAQKGVVNPLVLIIDDSSMARGHIKTVLEKCGVEVVEANNGRQGLDILRKWCEFDKETFSRLHFIVSDIEMPEMDGYSFTLEVKNDDLLKHLYVALHTSLTGAFNENLISTVGADHFMPKFDPNAIRDLVLSRENIK